MKKFDEVKRNVTKFCKDHSFEIIMTSATALTVISIALMIRDAKEFEVNDNEHDSLVYMLRPANLMLVVPDADHIDDAIKYIKEHDVINPLDRDEFQRIIDTFTELKNNNN